MVIKLTSEKILYFGFFISRPPYMGVWNLKMSDHYSNNCAYCPQGEAVLHSLEGVIHRIEGFENVLSKQVPPNVGRG